MIDAPPLLPSIPAVSVPAITAAEMAEVDRLATHEFGISLPRMTEQAGTHLADVVRIELGGELSGQRVVVLVGPGGNGAGGLAAARHLANRGASVSVVLAQPVMRMPVAAREQLATLLAMQIDCCVATYDVSDAELERGLGEADAIVDALLGYGSVGEPDGEIRGLIDRLAGSDRPVVSLDLPSGLDATSGHAPDGAVSADATLTLALPKRGLLMAQGPDRSGRLYLGDLGLPAALYRRLGIEPGTPFAHGPVVRLDG